MTGGKTWHAILLVLGAVFLFACQDTIGKFLFAKHSVPFVQAVRYGVNLLLMLLIFVPRLGTRFMRSGRPLLAASRGLSLALGSLTGGLAFRYLPLAEANAILYLAPLGVLFLAKPVLGEQVRWFGWVATGFGFVGLLCIVHPGSNLSAIGLVYAFLCLITAVVYPLLSRILSKTERTETLMFYVASVGAAYYMVQLPWTMPPQWPALADFSLMLSLGAISLLGHGLFTMAYARAPVSLLAPFTYAHMLWAVLLGWLVFAQFPDKLAFVGIGLIALGGAGNAVMNHISTHKDVIATEPMEA
jgi:drug/metabolite transporter (DMT)-like permease